MKRLVLLFSMAVLVGAGSLQAATIVWSVDEFDAVADVSTQGTLVEAVNWAGAANGTINGVEFVAKPDTGTDLSTTHWSTLVDGSVVIETVFEGRSANWTPVDKAEVEDSNVMDSFIQENSAGAGETEVTLTGLEIGKLYEVQLFLIDDGRTLNNGAFHQVDALVSPYLVGAEYKQGTVFTGTFAADSTNQVFTLIRNKSGVIGLALNASQLRELDAGDNTAPYFTSDPILKPDADSQLAYSASLVADAADDEGDMLRFGKVDGPDWLVVSTNGAVGGIPPVADIGTNSFTVFVADEQGLSSSATLEIVVNESGYLPASIAYSPIDDAFVQETDPDSNYGLDEIIRLRELAGENRYGFLKFNIDYAPVLQRATLRVMPNSGGLGNLLFYEVSDTGWAETGITWNNKPAMGDQIGFGSAVDMDEWMEVDLSAYVTSTGTYAIGIQRPSQTQRSLYSSEANTGSSGPFLVVDFADNSNLPPAFSADTLNGPDAATLVSYRGNLNGDASDPDADSLVFSKQSGADWLNVFPGGLLSGNPATNHVGTNSFVVKVTDDLGMSDTATLNILVYEIEAGLSAATNAPIIPTDDTYVDQLVAITNYGSAATLEMRTNDDTDTRHAFLKFTVPEMEFVTGAKLRLRTVNILNQTLSIFSVPDTDWTEGSLYWTNAPAMGEFITMENGVSNSWVEFDVGTYVTGSGTYALGVVRGPESSQRSVSSKEGDYPPELVIEYLARSYASWIASYGLTNSPDADADYDYDGDGLVNLYEYGLGGSPVDGADTGYSPEFGVLSDGVSNWIEYVYPQRVGSELDYYLELTTDLVYSPWIPAPDSVTGTGSMDADFDAVTNRIPTEGKTKEFIRLIIE